MTRLHYQCKLSIYIVRPQTRVVNCAIPDHHADTTEYTMAHVYYISSQTVYHHSTNATYSHNKLAT